MRVRFLKSGKMWIVETTYGNNIVFCHKSRKECYEWIFKGMSYA